MKKSDALNLLSKLISYKSVSTDPVYHQNLIKTVDFLKKLLTDNDFQVRIINKKKVKPFIFAEYNISSSKTIAIYGHYDIQPVSSDKNWQSDPFVLTKKNGKLFGRGVADNKGHIIQNIASISQLIKTNKIKNNIIFLLEGEEESGSVNFEYYCHRIKKKLDKVDIFFITDVGMHDINTPQIFYGLRGTVGFKLKIQTGKKELHSGVYGNRVYNASEIISWIINQLKNPINNKVLINSFYQNVRKFSKYEIKLLSKTLKSDSIEKKEARVNKLLKVNNKPSGFASKIYPSLDIHCLKSGYLGSGVKNIIPSKASLKATCRIVENQTPKEIKFKIQKYIKKIIPGGVSYNLEFCGLSDPFYCDYKNPILQKTADIISKQFKNKCLFNRSGGSIPAAEILQRLFKKPIILTGFTLPDDNIHSANENYDEAMFFKGIEVLKNLYGNI